MTELDKLDGDSERVKPVKDLVAKVNITGELVNLAAKLDDDTCQAIADRVIEGWREDEISRAGWLAKHGKWLELYNQNDKTIPPFPGASQESLPLLTEAVNQFQARAFKAFFPGRMFVSGMPVGKPDVALTQRADRVGKFMSWQLGVQDRSYKRNKNALLLGVAIHGSMFTKTCYDPLRRRNVVRNVRAEDLVIPYGIGPQALEEVERKTETIWTTVNETRRYTEIGYFLEPAEPYMGGEAQSRPTTNATDIATGVFPSGQNESKAFLLEQHTILDLDGDGIAEPYIAVVDVQSEKLLRLAVRYEVDAGGAPTAGKEPVEYYTHYQFLPNPEGFYGMGLGFMMMHPNLAVNKLLRLFIDAAMLSTAGNLSGFVSDQLALGKGEVELTIGKFKKVAASADDIAKGFKTMAFAGPTPALKDALTVLTGEARRLGTAVDVMSGDVDKVIQPTTMQTMEENALQIFSSVQEFLLESWTDELMKLYRLNGKYLPQELYVTIVGTDGPEGLAVSKQDFVEDLRVLPAADPRMSTVKQKQQQAQAVWQLTLSNPVTASNPEALMAAHLYVLESIGVDSPKRFVPPPPPAQPSPEEKELELKAAETEMKIKSQQVMGEQKLQQGQQKMELDAASAQQKMQLEMMKAQQSAALEAKKAGSQAIIQSHTADQQNRMATAQAGQDMAIKGATAKADIAQKQDAHKANLEMSKQKNDAAVAATKAKAAAKPKSAK